MQSIGPVVGCDCGNDTFRIRFTPRGMEVSCQICGLACGVLVDTPEPAPPVKF